MAQIKERRRRQRIDVALPAKLEYNKEKILTKTKNISLLGTYLQTDKKIPIGTALDIVIEIPKTKSSRKRQISCQGVVFRCQTLASWGAKKQYGIGVFFRTFLKGAEETLSNYIDYVLLEEERKGKIYMRKKGGKG